MEAIIQSPNASSLEEFPHPNPLLEKVIKLVDLIYEARGLNVPQVMEFEKLRTLPPGSFGRAWSDFLNANNLKPLCIGSRRKQVHDGFHVLTGYGIDQIGEAEVQMFLLGAKFSPLAVLFGLLLLPGIYRQQHYRPNFRHFSYDILWQAYQRGRNSRFDPDTWQPELLWELPLTDVQAFFNI